MNLDATMDVGGSGTTSAVRVTRITPTHKTPAPVPTPVPTRPKQKHSTPVQSAKISLVRGIPGVTPLPALTNVQDMLEE